LSTFCWGQYRFSKKALCFAAVDSSDARSPLLDVPGKSYAELPFVAEARSNVLSRPPLALFFAHLLDALSREHFTHDNLKVLNKRCLATVNVRNHVEATVELSGDHSRH